MQINIYLCIRKNYGYVIYDFFPPLNRSYAYILSCHDNNRFEWKVAQKHMEVSLNKESDSLYVIHLDTDRPQSFYLEIALPSLSI